MTGLFRRLLGGFCKGIVSTWHLIKKDHPAIYRMMWTGWVVYGIVLTLSFYNGSYWIEDDQWNGFLQQPNWAGFILFFPLLKCPDAHPMIPYRSSEYPSDERDQSVF